MKVLKIALALAIAAISSFTAQAKNDPTTAYMFGFASSFSDSTVYMTSVQRVDSVYLTHKKLFLDNRENYSLQLKEYLESIGAPKRTCIVIFDRNFKKAEKKWTKLHDRYTKQAKAKRLKNGEKIPTLDEYLAQGEKSKKTVLVFELKKQIDKAHEDYMVDQSVKALKEHGLYNPKRVIFISFSLNMCERLAALCPGFTVQYLDKDKSPEELAKLGINGVDYQYKVFGKNPTWFKQARDNKMSINCWTVNKEKDIQDMIDLGVDCITTNEPLLVREKLGKREKVK